MVKVTVKYYGLGYGSVIGLLFGSYKATYVNIRFTVSDL